MNTKRLIKYVVFGLAFAIPLQFAFNPETYAGIGNMMWFIVALAMIGYASSIAVDKN